MLIRLRSEHKRGCWICSSLLSPFILALEQRTCSLPPLRLFVFPAGRNWHSRERRVRDLPPVGNTLPRNSKITFGSASCEHARTTGTDPHSAPGIGRSRRSCLTSFRSVLGWGSAGLILLALPFRPRSLLEPYTHRPPALRLIVSRLRGEGCSANAPGTQLSLGRFCLWAAAPPAENNPDGYPQFDNNDVVLPGRCHSR